MAKPNRKKPAKAAGKPKSDKPKPKPKAYGHPDASAPQRPEVGIESAFTQRKPPTTYRYDRSLDPQLSWDEGNAEREFAEALIKKIQIATTVEEARSAAKQLEAMSRPFLNWAGKAERGSFDVPTLPLFIHDRLSTEAILETLRSHKPQKSLGDFYGDPGLPIADRKLKAYTHGPWTNRLILGDSLVVMNSLLQYEGMAGKVQMIYIDPPYGVKFGSNFQPFVRARSVEHNKDDALTREPEMVQAYRDTWECGIHSYLTYLRDRLHLAKRLLSEKGSVFVQISEDHVHRVRVVLDEVFGGENHVATITFVKQASSLKRRIDTANDFLLWYAKDSEKVKYNPVFVPRRDESVEKVFVLIELPDGSVKRYSEDERYPEGSRRLMAQSIYSRSGGEKARFGYKFGDKTFLPPPNYFWSTNEAGMDELEKRNRLIVVGKHLRRKVYLDDFPLSGVTTVWTDTMPGGFSSERLYVVQTASKVVERCVLLSTDPGDLILDPTCGSGTTAFVSEHWGRRWITMDTSRVPLSLARQRLLTATYPYYELMESIKGPGAGFVYKRRQNRAGQEVGGIVPQVTLRSIAQDEAPEEKVVVDRPEVDRTTVRVSGPFTVEAVVPAPFEALGNDAQAKPDEALQELSHIDRMIEILKKSSKLQVGRNEVGFENIRRPIRAVDIHALADQAFPPGRGEVAFVFGPLNGAVTEGMILRSRRECYQKDVKHLYVIGFAIQDAASKMVAQSTEDGGVPVSYVAARPDIVMGDLLKTRKTDQMFVVTGRPDVKLVKLKTKGKDGEPMYRVELQGLDTFDPVNMEIEHKDGTEVPAWFLDTDYNEMCFWVSQAFFPKAGAWDNIKKALKGEYNESVFDHLAGTKSEPFSPGENERIAVKAVDARGNELLVVVPLSEAVPEA